MTIEQKLISKLEPHAKRIKEDNGNDFDYLPAVLLQVMEEQKRQVKLLDATEKRLVEQIAVLVRAHEVHIVQTKESLSAVGVQLESLTSFSKQAYLKCMRLLIAGLVASTATIGLLVAVLQRH